MKKVRIIVAVVAAALMVMGVGYATVWSDKFPINLNAGMATFDVSPVADSGQKVAPANNPYAVTNIAVSASQVDITANKLLPGDRTTFCFKVKNNSTDVSVNLKGAKITFTDTNDAMKWTGIMLGIGAADKSSLFYGGQNYLKASTNGQTVAVADPIEAGTLLTLGPGAERYIYVDMQLANEDYITTASAGLPIQFTLEPTFELVR